MKIDVVEFYEDRRGKRFLGTLHMFLVDDEMDIRGISVFKIKNSYFIQPPSLKSKEGECYGCIAFTNQAKQQDFMKSVVGIGIRYMKNLEGK